MQKLLVIATTLLTINAIACDKSVSYQLRKEIRSDYPLEVKFMGELAAGDDLVSNRGHKIASFNKDMLIYSAIGSEHSGWFNAAVAVDKKTCKVEKIGYFAAE